MVWPAIIAAGVQTGLSLMGGKKGSDAAKKAGKLNAANIRAETAETIRRTELQNQAKVGSAIAGVGGSGVRMDGTPNNYLSAMQTEQQTQVDWMQDAGERQARIARETGGQVASASMLSGVTNAASIWSNAYIGGAFDSNKTSGYNQRQPDFFSAPQNPTNSMFDYNNNYSNMA